MYVNGQVVNVLPPQLPPSRVAELLTEYRRRLRNPGKNDPPKWYSASVVAALESYIRDQAVTR